MPAEPVRLPNCLLMPLGIQSWVEFRSRAEWEQAGKPRPIAVATNRSDRVVHVAMTFNEDATDGTLYASDCYTPEGKLAPLASGPRVPEACDDAYFQCQLTLGVASFSPRLLLFSSPLSARGGARGTEVKRDEAWAPRPRLEDCIGEISDVGCAHSEFRKGFPSAPSWRHL